MSEHFIKEIEIKKYKLFKDFKAEGFGRVNLIGGKNNVGKTAFMEACFLSANSINLEYLAGALINIWFIRNYIECEDAPEVEQLIEQFNNINIRTNKNYLMIKIDSNDGKIFYNFNINKKIIKQNKKDFSVNEKYTKNIGFLDNTGITYEEIVELYEAIQENDREEELNKEINRFDSNIEKFKIFKDIPKIKLKNLEKYIELKELGDGLKEFISIISAIYSSKNGYLFIDEIANGIHYTNLDRLWEIILTLSKEQNVQVFATTHSIECIESYARVSKKLLEDKKIDKEDIAFIEMGINKYDKPRAIVMDSERFFDELEIGNEVRGW